MLLPPLPLPLTHGTRCCWSAAITVSDGAAKSGGRAGCGRAAGSTSHWDAACALVDGPLGDKPLLGPTAWMWCPLAGKCACCPLGCRRAAIVPALGHPAGGVGAVRGARARALRHNSGPAGLAAGARRSGKALSADIRPAPALATACHPAVRRRPTLP